MEYPIINPALSHLMKHLVIGQRKKAPNFSAFHWSPHGSLVSIGQHFVTTRVVHLPKRIETSLITEADLITDSDQAVRSWIAAIAGSAVFYCVAILNRSQLLQEKICSCRSKLFPIRVDYSESAT